MVDVLDGFVYVDIQRLNGVGDIDGLGVAVENIVGPMVRVFELR